MTLEQKFSKIKHKIIFYTEVSVNTKTEASTIRQSWFNKSRGIAIPEKHLQSVQDSLDKCIRYEAEEKKIFDKYFKS